MITSVTVRRFKKFLDERVDLGEAVLLAGPNNGGKSTVLHALAVWRFALDHWMARRPGTSTARDRTGVALTRQQLTAIPLREMALLWEGRQTAGRDVPTGAKRRIEILVEGDDDGGWSCGIELEYANPESVYVRPLGALDAPDLSGYPPSAAKALLVVHVPPLSGIAREEPRYDRAYQDLLIGQGNPGQVLRNLLVEVAADDAQWTALRETTRDLFAVELLEPQSVGLPYIVSEYRDPKVGRPLDLSNAGSGFLQVLLLFAFFHGRPGSTLLLDEPDAHLHIILQKEVFDRLREVAARRRSQLIIATHSEVFLDDTSPGQVVSFAGAPRALSTVSERDRLREAMKRLSTTELLLGAQTGRILYLESRSDERILSAWATVLDHAAQPVLEQPFVHPLRGNSLREARSHFFAFRSVAPSVRGLVVLDGDDRSHTEDMAVDDGLRVVRWPRYEIENYLLVPRAIAEVAGWGEQTLFTGAIEERVLAAFHRQVPMEAELFSDIPALRAVKASTEFLPELLEAAGRPLPKSDFFLVAAAMRPEEVHPDVISTLDAIADLLPHTDHDDEGTA